MGFSNGPPALAHNQEETSMTFAKFYYTQISKVLTCFIFAYFTTSQALAKTASTQGRSLANFTASPICQNCSQITLNENGKIFRMSAPSVMASIAPEHVDIIIYHHGNNLGGVGYRNVESVLNITGLHSLLNEIEQNNAVLFVPYSQTNQPSRPHRQAGIEALRLINEIVRTNEETKISIHLIGASGGGFSLIQTYAILKNAPNSEFASLTLLDAVYPPVHEWTHEHWMEFPRVWFSASAENLVRLDRILSRGERQCQVFQEQSLNPAPHWNRSTANAPCGVIRIMRGAERHRAHIRDYLPSLIRAALRL